MKRLFYVVVTLFACVAAYQAVAHNVDAGHLKTGKARDWKREAELMANDLPQFLHYHPTDGASDAGKVRKAMDPSHVYP